MTSNFFSTILVDFWQLCYYILRAFVPLFTGLIIAYLLNEPVDFVSNFLCKNIQNDSQAENSKSRIWAIIITYLAVALIIASIIFAFIILMLGSLPSENWEDTIYSIYDYVESTEMFSQWLDEHLAPERLVALASKFAEAVVNVFLGIVASIYLLKDKDFFLLLCQRFLSVFLKQRTHGILCEVLYEINAVISTFLKGAFIDSILVALLSSIVLSLLGVKYAAIIGIIGGILNIIPYFGPFLGMIPAFGVSLANQGMAKAIISVIALFAVQQLDSNYIYPKIVGTTTGLHPLFVLLSVSVMGYFAGLLGMLVAVPVAGIFQVIIKKWFYSK